MSSCCTIPELRKLLPDHVSEPAGRESVLPASRPDKLGVMDFQARQRKLREHLATTRFDGLLISHLPNIRYLCGFTGSAGLLLVEEAGSVFFTDVRYDIQAHEEVKASK